MGKYKSYEDFLNKIYPNLYFSSQVQHLLNNGDTRNEAVKKYIEKLEEIHEKAFSSKRQGDISLLKRFYHENYVIKEGDISENYFRFLDKQYFDKYGVHMNDEVKHTHIENIIEDQKKSLNVWIDYLSSKDAKFYPMWAKYWAFQGMLTIGTYDNKNQIYNKRTKETVALFVELNREALAKCIDYIIKLVDGEKIDTLYQINGENFAKMYQVLLNKFKEVTFDKTTIDGKWIKYEQGDNYLPLYNSLQGYGTGWCTAGEDTCKNQIKNGDFYVYYTFDKDNNPVVPRIAIRMDGSARIGEIRGVAKNQNIESHLEEVLAEKLKEFPDRKDYEKRIGDSKKLTEIYIKYEQKIELTLDELKFIYEIEQKISGFGYDEDPRIAIIKKSRNIRDDYSKIYSANRDEMAESQKQFLDNPSKYKILFSDLILSKVTSAEGQLPIITGNLDLRSLICAKGLHLPQNLGGSLFLNSLANVEGLKLPKTIGGYLNLNSLVSSKGLNLPRSIGGDLYLNGLTSAKGLDLTQTAIGGDLHLNGITSAEGLKLPQNIDGSLYLNGLTSAEGLNLPQSIGGSLYLNGLTSTKGLSLPQSIGGDLYLNGITSAEGLNLPQSIGGSLYLNGLTSAEDLDLLQTTVGGDLILSGLTSAEGLRLPQNMKGGLSLYGLTSVDGLELPEGFDLANLYCKSQVKEQLIERKGFKR